MPTYFFHSDNGVRFADQVGTELPDDASAHRAAIKLAGAMMHDDPQLLWNGQTFSTEVAEHCQTGRPATIPRVRWLGLGALASLMY